MPITLLRIDGCDVYDTCPRALTAHLLASPANIQYWSADGLYELLVGTCAMVKDWCKARITENAPEDTKAKCRRYPAWATRAIKNFPRKSQEIALTYLYNIIMAGEGMGLLPGFGMSNAFKDNIKGNPEVQTLRRPQGSFF